MNTNRVITVFMTLPLLVALVACSDHTPGVPFYGEVGVAVAPSSLAGNTASNAGPTLGVSGGGNQKGVTMPTATGIVARIQNGLQGSVTPTTGNFARGLSQVKSNLPNASDINKSSGFDQAQLLVYAACSDLTTGTTPLMRTRYGVDPNNSPAASQGALVAAGMNMLDQHLAQIASQGPVSSQLNSILTTLVQTQSSAGNSTKIIFMSVCIAANTAGAVMLGL